MTPALFPGYIFVLIELQWHAIRRTPYVVRLIMNGDQPARVPDRIIEELRLSKVSCLRQRMSLVPQPQLANVSPLRY